MMRFSHFFVRYQGDEVKAEENGGAVAGRGEVDMFLYLSENLKGR